MMLTFNEFNFFYQVDNMEADNMEADNMEAAALVKGSMVNKALGAKAVIKEAVLVNKEAALAEVMHMKLFPIYLKN